MEKKKPIKGGGLVQSKYAVKERQFFRQNFERSDGMDEKRKAEGKQSGLFARLRVAFQRVARALGGGK